MKIKNTNSSVVLGATNSCVQTISAKNASKATFILRDKIYTDKKKAALYETLANALDEHKKHNVSRPVDVYISETELCIRDYGAGLSDEDVMSVFFQYFESTKDQDNTYNGGFGIGAKAPGAYTDVYHVESYFNGMRTIFSSVVQGLESHVHKMHAEPSEAPSGICVRIPLRQSNERYYRSDRQGFLDLLEDAYITVDIYSKECPFQVWDLQNKSLDYDACVEYVAQHGDKLRSSALLPENRLADMVQFDKNGNPKHLAFCSDTAHVVTAKTTFKKSNIQPPAELPKLLVKFESEFFCNRRLFAHDGSFMYPIPMAIDSIISDICSNSPELQEGWFSFLRWYSTRIVLFFERGELAVAPTRESIELTDTSRAVIRRKFKELMHDWIAKIKHYRSIATWRNYDKEARFTSILGCAMAMTNVLTLDNRIDSVALPGNTVTSIKEEFSDMATRCPYLLASAVNINLSSLRQTTTATAKSVVPTEWINFCLPNATWHVVGALPGLLVVTYDRQGMLDVNGKPVSSTSIAFRAAFEEFITAKGTNGLKSYSVLFMPRLPRWADELKEVFTINNTLLLGPNDVINWEQDLRDIYHRVKKERAAQASAQSRTLTKTGKPTATPVCTDYFDFTGDVQELYSKGEKVIYYADNNKAIPQDDTVRQFFRAIAGLYSVDRDGFATRFWVAKQNLYCGLCTLLGVRGIIRHSNKATYERLVDEVGEDNIINITGFTEEQICKFMDQRVRTFFNKNKLKLRHVPTANSRGLLSKLLKHAEHCMGAAAAYPDIPVEKNVIYIPIYSYWGDTRSNVAQHRILSKPVLDPEIMHGELTAHTWDTDSVCISAAIAALSFAMYTACYHTCTSRDSGKGTEFIIRKLTVGAYGRNTNLEVWTDPVDSHLAARLAEAIEKQGDKLDWLWRKSEEDQLLSYVYNNTSKIAMSYDTYHTIKQRIQNAEKENKYKQLKFLLKLWYSIKPMSLDHALRHFEKETKTNETN